MEEVKMLSLLSSRQISIGCGGLTLLIGAVGLVGWVCNVRILTSFLKTEALISPDSAILLITLGLTLVFQVRYQQAWVKTFTIIVSCITLIMGIEALINIVLDTETGIGSLFFTTSPLIGTYHAGIMSPITALCFLLFALILLSLALAYPQPAGIIGIITGSIGGVILIGYSFGAPILYGGPFNPVSLPSGIGIFFLSCGYISLAGTGVWPLSEFSGSSSHSILIRFLFPVTVALIIALEWIDRAVTESLSISPALITSFEVMIAIIIIPILVSFLSRTIGGRIDEVNLALHESEEKYRIIANSTSDVIWQIEISRKRFMFISPSVEQMRGFTPDEVMQAPLSAALTQESYSEVYRSIQERLFSFQQCKDQQSSSYTDLWDQPCSDGSIIHTESTWKFIRNPKTGNPEMIGVTRDITEQKKNIEELTLLAALLDVSPIGVIVHDDMGNILFTNTAGLEYHGYTREEFLALSLSDLTVPEDTRLIRERLLTITTDQIMSFIVHHYRKDRTIIPIQVYARKTRVGDRELIVSINIDISERILKDEQIQRERDRAEMYLDVAQVMIMVLDKDARISKINKKGIEILGLPYDEIVGTDWYQRFIPESERTRGRVAYEQIMAGDIRSYASLENTILAGDGTEKVLLMKSVLIKKDNEAVGLLVSGEDITIRKRLELEKEKALYEIQQNLAKLAILNDEIRNPLTIISSIAEMETDDKTYQSLLIHINRIDEMINGLDHRWADSQKVLSFLRKHYEIDSKGTGLRD
jgi:PAS domain S-box-containing protein